mmetsp:Transcript_32160/g.75497  ORF Transcript_32160/g.75497 Transcript_32160/m.75497 type:complete len:279 (+) Transcript_32160:435-1271(+)
MTPTSMAATCAVWSTNVLSRLRSCSLAFPTEWPVRRILDDQALAEYNAIFRFLLRLKRVEYTLRRCPLPRNLSCSHGSVAARLIATRSYLLHVVGNLQSYAISRVVHTTSAELDTAIAAETTVTNVIQRHTDFLSTLRDRCLLNRKAAVISDAVSRILDLALALRRAAHDATNAPLRGLVARGGDVSPRERGSLRGAVAHLELDFDDHDHDDDVAEATQREEAERCERELVRISKEVADSTKLVTVVLAKAITLSFQPHLADLLGRLDFNGFVSRTRK